MAKKDETFSDEAKKKQRGLFAEFFYFATQTKKWWLLPILAVILIVSVLVMLGSTGAAPFIYSLF